MSSVCCFSEFEAESVRQAPALRAALWKLLLGFLQLSSFVNRVVSHVVNCRTHRIQLIAVAAAGLVMPFAGMQHLRVQGQTIRPF